MDRYPFQKSVGDLLAYGVYIDPVQQELESAPGGRPVLAVWGVPDPILESGAPWYINGMPVVIPSVLKTCAPDENIQHLVGPRLTLAQAIVSGDEGVVLEHPSVIGEMHDGFDMPWHIGDYEVLDGHYARQLFDSWPVEENDAHRFTLATMEGLQNSGYFELVDYFNWENGLYEPESQEEYEHVIDSVEDGCGNLKDPDDFVFSLHLPREDRYTWEQLQDLSNQGWTSLGLSLPEEERNRFFRSRGMNPWY